MNVTTQGLRCQRTLGLVALANCLRLLRSAKDLALTPFNRMPATIRLIFARVEHGFEDFAKIPHQDALTRQELAQLIDEFDAGSRTEKSE